MKFRGFGILILDKKRIRFKREAGKDIYTKGVYETEDKIICAKLIALGYKGEGEAPKEAVKEKAPAKKKAPEEVKDVK